MKKTTPGGKIEVRSGEPFIIYWLDNSLSGFDMDVTVPWTIEEVATHRHAPAGLGGGGKVVRQFRCRKPGRYEIMFSEGRPWEDDVSRFPVQVDCR